MHSRTERPAWVRRAFSGRPERADGSATRDKALINAADASLLGRIKDGNDIPAPSSKSRGSEVVCIAAQATAKLAFYAFRESGSRCAPARKIGKHEAEIRRMLDPYHATKLPPLEKALLALGKRFVIYVQAA